MMKLRLVTINDDKKNGFPAVGVKVGLSLISNPWIKHINVVKVSKYTKYSMKVIFRFGGIWSRITGMTATNANIKAARFYILPAKADDW